MARSAVASSTSSTDDAKAARWIADDDAKASRWIADDDAKASRWLGPKGPIHLEVIASPGTEKPRSPMPLLAQLINAGDGITSR
jgi:hypothetical protein